MAADAFRSSQTRSEIQMLWIRMQMSSRLPSSLISIILTASNSYRLTNTNEPSDAQMAETTQAELLTSFLFVIPIDFSTW